MNIAPRFPWRWAGPARTLLTTAAVWGTLAACAQIDGFMYGDREGTIEYPGSGAGPNAVAIYVARDKETVDTIARRYGVTAQSIVDRNRLQPPYTLRGGQKLEIPGA